MLARRLQIAMGLLCVITALCVALASTWVTSAAIEPLAQARHREHLKLRARTLAEQVGHLRQEALVLLHATPAAELAEAARQGAPLPQAARARMVQIFSAHMAQYPRYLQIRLISVANGGSELVRVEREAAGAPARNVSGDQLQQKGKRPYFLKALQLPSNDVFVGDIELNREWDKIQLPVVPVIRASTPVHSADGSAIGALVVNIDLRDTFNEISLGGDGERLYLIDAGGNFLIHPEHNREFQGEFGTPNLAAREFPSLAAAFAKGESFIENRPGDEGTVTVAAEPIRLAGGPQVYLVSEVADLAKAAGSAAFRATAVVALLVTLAAILLASMIARRITKPLATLTHAAERYPEPIRFVVESKDEVGILARALHRMDEDIRERGKAVEIEERRYRQLFEASPTALIKVGSDHAIVRMNRSAELLFGYSREELIGQPVALLVPETAREAHAGYMQRFAADPRARAMGAESDLFALQKNGSAVPVEIGLVPIETPEGRFTLASIVDVSARRAYQNEIKRSNAHLAEFAYVASHDLQEPLRMVSSYTELLARKYRGQLDPQADKYIGFAVEGARRLKDLVASLLEYSRLGSEVRPLAPTSAQGAVTDVVESLEPLLQETSAEVVIVDAPLPRVMADVVLLRQLFQNLITNALKFRSEQVPRIEISASMHKGLVRIAVRDNGMGIEPRYQARIFEMFQRLHERGAYSGSGMGLAIVMKIVDRHGGKIWVESELGAGATFYFTLQPAPPPDTAGV